jgi:hypothetical protein
MATRIQVTIDCADPDRMARFWAQALHYQLQEPPAGFDTWEAYWRSLGIDEEFDDGYDAVVDPAGIGPRMWFQKVPEPKVGKNRLHLDLSVSGGRANPIEIRRERVDAEAERLVNAGASTLRVLSEPGIDHYAVVMRDPEGNEFCIH